MGHELGSRVRRLKRILWCGMGVFALTPVLLGMPLCGDTMVEQAFSLGAAPLAAAVGGTFCLRGITDTHERTAASMTPRVVPDVVPVG